jgi:hypothetical protein
MPERCDECLYWPAAVRTAELVATLAPARAYWAACAVCGTTIDLAAAARVRVMETSGQCSDAAGNRATRGNGQRLRASP